MPGLDLRASSTNLKVDAGRRLCGRLLGGIAEGNDLQGSDHREGFRIGIGLFHRSPALRYAHGNFENAIRKSSSRGCTHRRSHGVGIWLQCVPCSLDVLNDASPGAAIYASNLALGRKGRSNELPALQTAKGVPYLDRRDAVIKLLGGNSCSPRLALPRLLKLFICYVCIPGRGGRNANSFLDTATHFRKCLPGARNVTSSALNTSTGPTSGPRRQTFARSKADDPA